jgi:SpoVK/Ycf46/Vps4 family AAA+-type ATPase
MTTGYTRADLEDIAEAAAKKAVRETLLTIGVDIANPIDVQRDFAVMRQIGRMAMDAEFRKDLEHARSWRQDMERPDGAADDLADARKRRKAVEAIKSKGVMTAVGIIATGFLGALFIGLQQMFARGH